MEISLHDRYTRKPVAGVEIRLQKDGGSSGATEDSKTFNGRTDEHGQVVFNRVPENSWDMKAFRDGREFYFRFTVQPQGSILIVGYQKLTENGRVLMWAKSRSGNPWESDLVFSLRSLSRDGRWLDAGIYGACGGAPTGEQLRKLQPDL